MYHDTKMCMHVLEPLIMTMHHCHKPWSSLPQNSTEGLSPYCSTYWIESWAPRLMLFIHKLCTIWHTPERSKGMVSDKKKTTKLYYDVVLQTLYHESYDCTPLRCFLMKEAQEVLEDECETHWLGPKLWDCIRELGYLCAKKSQNMWDAHRISMLSNCTLASFASCQCICTTSGQSLCPCAKVLGSYWW